LPELATFKSVLGEIKLAVDSENPLIEWLVWLLQSRNKLNFDFSGGKLFIKSVIKSMTLVSCSIIHGHIPGELPDYDHYIIIDNTKAKSDGAISYNTVCVDQVMCLQ